MQKHKGWIYGLAVLSGAIAMPGFASETWHVTSGPNGEEHSTWTLKQEGGGTSGHAEFTGSDGSKTNFEIYGNSDALRVMRMRPRGAFCQFDVHEISAEKASGIEWCVNDEARFPWGATIDNSGN